MKTLRIGCARYTFIQPHKPTSFFWRSTLTSAGYQPSEHILLLYTVMASKIALTLVEVVWSPMLKRSAEVQPSSFAQKVWYGFLPLKRVVAFANMLRHALSA